MSTSSSQASSNSSHSHSHAAADNTGSSNSSSNSSNGVAQLLHRRTNKPSVLAAAASLRARSGGHGVETRKREVAEERAKLQPQVEETVGTLFELRQEQRKAQLREMEAKLERLRSDIEARDARKDQLVDDFTTRLLRAVERGGER
mgnify:CR=1 FL=1